MFIKNIIQMQQQKKPKQSTFHFQTITITSKFESGNLEHAQLSGENQFNLWIGSDPNANYKTWFYFSIQGVKIGTTLSFTIVNMNNQVKLYKEGLVPVFKTQNSKQWSRIKIPITANGVVKGELGFQVAFKHLFNQSCKHYFAFTYPWTTQQNDQMIQKLMEKNSTNIFCKYQKIGNSFQGRPVNLLTLTKSAKGQNLKFQIQKVDNNEITIFPDRKGIFISARVHPGETASSHIMNGIIKELFSNSQNARNILQNCVIYLIPIINPDGVAEGCFRTDSQGKNLNRYYTNPTFDSEPQIYHIKQFLLSLIRQKRIVFCLDLHAHVNKQGAFMYGNSTNNLYNQMRVCLFPKLLSFNSEIFDFDSCNFSQKNMSSKDKGDELSKEGASRVAIFKETNLVECWTLECNYNSAKIFHNLLEPVPEVKNNSVSHAVVSSRIQPDYKEQVKFLDIPDFQKLGYSILESIADFYCLKPYSRIFSTKLKNTSNLQINISITSLRLIPFRFDTECRKILDNINSSVNVKACLDKIGMMMAAKGNKIILQTLISSTKQITTVVSEGTNSAGKKEQSVHSKGKVESTRTGSLRKIDSSMQRKQNKTQKVISLAIKIQQKVNKIIPTVPLPRAKK